MQESEPKSHPWRRCAKGTHFVREHIVHVEPNQTHPDGIIHVHSHCANNPSRKEELSYAEIQYISNQYFNDLTGSPTQHALNFHDGNTYNKEIREWTKYWNDIFHLENPLDPNIVKALIATESGFRIDPPENKIAHGVMQLTPQTHSIIQNIHGELKDHLIRITAEELFDPSANICAGVRWLFRKRETAKHKLKQEPTWIETIAEYKGILDSIIANVPYDKKPMEDLDGYYKILCENK